MEETKKSQSRMKRLNSVITVKTNSLNMVDDTEEDNYFNSSELSYDSNDDFSDNPADNRQAV